MTVKPNETQAIHDETRQLATRAKSASRGLSIAETDVKNAVLLRAAAALRGPQGDLVVAANLRDVARAEASGLAPAMLERLRLDRARLDQVAEGVEEVASLPDPVGQVVEERRLANGLRVSRSRAPLGLIGMIYESRPNVTADAAALCIKSGNACLLRGGKEAFESNRAIAEIIRTALRAESLNEDCVALLPTTDRRATLAMIGLAGIVDLVIPRGGESLIRFVAENARVPVIQHYKGVCHVYVDGDADLAMALKIAINAKTHRPSVCNAMETLLVDRACADVFIPQVVAAMKERDVRVIGDAITQGLAEVEPATHETFDTEHLALVMGLKVVDGVSGAIAHIAVHGSNHTEAIVTEDAAKGERFVREVDASLVLINASTRFNDGHQLGLGAEIGISTTKLHAYGAMGLAELCTLKWVGRGAGQVRS